MYLHDIQRDSFSDPQYIAADSTKKLSAYYERGLAKVKIGEFQSAILDFDIYIVMLPSDENGYVNPRTGIIMSNELKAKISLRKKELKCSADTKNPKFTPWFISYPTYTQLFYDITKVQQSLTDGYASTYYQTLADKSKGVKLIKRGKMKGCVIGHIPINSR